MDVNQCIVKVLESVGVDHVFGGSGQVNASMLMGLRDSRQIKTIIVKNEQAASFMACGYAMFSHKLGVCFATGGPGAFNLFSGMAVALSDSLPVIGITGYASKNNRGKGALNESTGMSRTPDSHLMFSATTKKSFIIEDPKDTCDILEEAINLAFAGRPGPVHVHVPKNITIAEVPNFRDIQLEIKPVLPASEDVEAVVEKIFQTLSQKEQMIILVGYGCIRSESKDLLLNLIEKYQIPFASTMDAKGYLPENHALALGVYGTSGSPGANQYFEDSSTILSMGNSFAQNATFGFKADLFDNKTLIHINIDEHEIGKVYPADFKIVSDIQPALEKIIEGLDKKSLKVETQRIKKEKWYDLPIENKSAKIHPAELVKEISDHLPAGSIIMGDAGAHMLWLNCYLDLNEGQCYQNPGSFGPMASHTNGCIGVKCANPDKTVVAAVGDGCYLMAGFELMTAIQYNIPVVWVIFNNGEFNVIKKFLLNMYNDHAHMQFNNPDFVKYAEACGTKGFHVDKIEDFAAVFQKALSLNQPVIIDVTVDSEVYPPFSLSKV